MDATRKTDAVKAKQGLDTLFEISQILGTGLDKETLSVLVALCETGACYGLGEARQLLCSLSSCTHLPEQSKTFSVLLTSIIQ